MVGRGVGGVKAVWLSKTSRWDSREECVGKPVARSHDQVSRLLLHLLSKPEISNWHRTGPIWTADVFGLACGAC